VFDLGTGRPVEASRATLALDGVEPALDSTYAAKLADGRTVEVDPAFELLRRRLEDYGPEQAASLCGVSPEVIAALARKFASKKTRVAYGRGGGKYYHGDLMERAMLLVLALTGNWGKKGAGDGDLVHGRWLGLRRLRRQTGAWR